MQISLQSSLKSTPRLRTAIALAALLGGLAQAWAAPFVPAHDTDVVERLPARIGSTEQRQQQRQARARLQHDPAQLPLALQLAREAIDRARRLGDPRELGQAQAALSPWWSLAEPPAAVRLLRAIVQQSQHNFPAALTDLDALLQPGSHAPLALQAQAELTRASVLQVQGRWRDANASCERLASARYAAIGNAVQVPAQACLAELMSLQGHSAQAQQRLAALAQQAEADGSAAWLALVRAELAERRGDESAQVLFRQALAADGDPADVYTLAAYADWLLARNRSGEVVTLLTGREDADALLLRLAIALQRANDPRAPAAIRTLADRFDAAALRGDRSHGREQSRFELELRHDAGAALTLAEANWQVQREPADALVLLRAAQAAQRPQASEPVWQLVRETGWDDVRLKPFAPVGTAMGKKS